MKYFSGLGISYRRGNLSMVMGSSLKATKGIIKARCSGPNPHMGANIIAGGAQRSSLVEVVDPHKGSKGAVIKRCDALSGPDDTSILT